MPDVLKNALMFLLRAFIVVIITLVFEGAFSATETLLVLVVVLLMGLVERANKLLKK